MDVGATDGGREGVTVQKTSISGGVPDRFAVDAMRSASTFWIKLCHYNWGCRIAMPFSRSTGKFTPMTSQ